ncbi:MAG: hypothetical protein M0R03_13130 [Novosphingobium sp.]|nr:hypothetical protein [Novosphingobium sp.]
MNIKELENKIESFTSEVDRLKGKLSTLEDQFVESQERFDNLKIEKELNSKAVEVLTLVQDSTKTLIINMFESLVTHALQFIHQSDEYKFELDFGRRGNLPELSFNILTPGMQEPHDIMTTRGGGTCDTTSLALREVLLEVSKTNGFLFLDEPFKHLDNDETVMKGMEFIKEIQKKTGRQIMIITHKTIIADNEEGVVWIK